MGSPVIIIRFTEIKISNKDYTDYINVSFNCGITIPNGYRFNDVHRFLSEHISNLKPLANILENILFLKMILKNNITEK